MGKIIVESLVELTSFCGGKRARNIRRLRLYTFWSNSWKNISKWPGIDVLPEGCEDKIGWDHPQCHFDIPECDELPATLVPSCLAYDNRPSTISPDTAPEHMMCETDTKGKPKHPQLSMHCHGGAVHRTALSAMEPLQPRTWTRLLSWKFVLSVDFWSMCLYTREIQLQLTLSNIHSQVQYAQTSKPVT